MIKRLAHNRIQNGPLLLAAALICSALILPAQAQDDAETVRDEQFIGGLAAMGLHDLIEGLVENPPANPDEAAGLSDALITAYLPALREQSTEAFFDGVNMIIAYQNRLLENEANRDHWARPMWMADFGQQMMFNGLPVLQQAGDFALFGFPDAQQRRLVDTVAAESYRQMSRAEDEHFRLVAVLRADPQFAVRYVNTGLWDQMRTYMDLNIPFYRSWAAVYLLTQPDDGPYFTAQQGQGHSPQAARTRLIQQANSDLENILTRVEALQLQDDTQARVKLLQGELAGQQGNYDRAGEIFAQAAALEETTAYTQLLIGLARAKALQKAGKDAETTELLNSLTNHEMATGNPLMQVLIADRRFFIHYDKAMTLADPERARPVLAQAFAEYDKLLASDLLGEWQAAIQSIIEERYRDQVPPGIPADKLPPTLRFASVRGTIERAEQLLAAGQADEAKPLYERAITEAQAFLRTPDLDKGIQAQTMYYIGFAQLRLGQAGYALQTMNRVADSFPDQDWGQRAINIAVINLAKPLYESARDNEAVRQLYEQALKIAIEKYPNTEIGQLSTYDLAAFYRVRERYIDAVAAYDNVPRNHPAYVNARYERLACLGAMWSDAPPAEKAPQGQALIPAVNDFLQLAERTLADGTANNPQQLRQYMANAHLLKAGVFVESLNMPNDARQTIAEVERNFGDIEAIKPRVLALNIRIYQRSGDFDRAEQAILDYMRSEPQRAGPLALGVLKSLISQIEELAAAGDDAAALNRLADVAVNLAERVVLPWAEGQADMDEEQQMALHRIPAEAELAAGRADAAATRYQQIVTKFGSRAQNNIDIVRGQAEANFKREQFREASLGFNKIIRFYQETGTGRDSTFWHSYMRVMQIVDRSATGKNSSIFLGIRNIQRNHPNLGGEPYRTELSRLLDKHAP